MPGNTVSRLQLTALLAAALALGAAGAVYADGFAPHLQNALVDLQNASGELQLAQPIANAHRTAALKLVHQALIQVNQAIAADGH
jgi:hypothetical protein